MRLHLRMNNHMGRKIYHRNDIRPALIDMKLSSRRLLFMWLASLPRERDVETGKLEIIFESSQFFEVNVIDYANICNIDYSAAYRQIIEGVEGLMSFVLTLDHTITNKIDPSLPKDWIAPFQVAEKGTGYSNGEGFVRIKFAEELKPLISNFSQGFTGQFLDSAISIPESNSSKLYLLLREWVSSNKYINEKIIEFITFKKDLGVEKSTTYNSFNDFNYKFFRRALVKVIEKTEFTSISMEISERRARKAYKVKITWTLDEKELEAKEREVEVFQNRYEKIQATNKKSQVKKVNLTEDINSSETLFFVNKGWLNRLQVEMNGLNWDDGVTAGEMLKVKK